MYVLRFRLMLFCQNREELCHQGNVGRRENGKANSLYRLLFLLGYLRPDEQPHGKQAEFEQRQILPVAFFQVTVGGIE